MTPKGSKNASKPGSLYSQFLSDEEKALEPDIEATLGDLRHELILAKIMVTRFAKKLGQPEVLEIESVTVSDSRVTGNSQVSKVRNYPAEADRWIARIASLTKQIYEIEQQKRNIRLAELEIEIKSAEAKDLADQSEATSLNFKVTRLTAPKEPDTDKA